VSVVVRLLRFARTAISTCRGVIQAAQYIFEVGAFQDDAAQKLRPSLPVSACSTVSFDKSIHSASICKLAESTNGIDVPDLVEIFHYPA
jgi:hypothetical protein